MFYDGAFVSMWLLALPLRSLGTQFRVGVLELAQDDILDAGCFRRSRSLSLKSVQFELAVWCRSWSRLPGLSPPYPCHDLDEGCMEKDLSDVSCCLWRSGRQYLSQRIDLRSGPERVL
jgi:hypothetical protein